MMKKTHKIIRLICLCLLVISATITPALAIDNRDDGNRADRLNLDFLRAAASGNLDEVKTLFDRGADIEAKNDVGATALMWAAMKGHPKVVEFLVSQGAKVNVAATTGMTPLKAAAAEGNAAIVEFLLKHGADMNVGARDNKSALELAKAGNHREVVQLLSKFDQESTRNTDRDRNERKASTATMKEDRIKSDGKSREDRISKAVVIGVDKPDKCLRVRTGPGGSHDVIGCLKLGDSIQLTGIVKDGWAEITEPEHGWVYGGQIKADGMFPMKKAATGKTTSSHTDAANETVQPDEYVMELPAQGSIAYGPNIATEMGTPPTAIQGRAGLPAPPALPALPAPPPLFR